MIARRIVLLAAAAALAGCQALPDKPGQPTLYDFGPVAGTGGAGDGTAPAGPPLLLPNVETSGVLETPALLYRLGYVDAHRLQPYAYARWSAPPADLMRQRLRDVLGRERPVLDSASSSALTRRGGASPPVLRVELEEFSQFFDSQSSSRGIVRLRCTLLESTSGGERLVAQRSFVVERPAPSADAAGGVRALAEAADAAAQDVAAWLRRR